jgi:hypothetical protein
MCYQKFLLLIFLLTQPIHHQADFGSTLALDLGKPTIVRNFIPTQSRFLQNIAKFNISHAKHKYFSPNQRQLSQFSDSNAKFLYLSIIYT